MIYLIRKNGIVIAHTDLEAMEALDGISTPDMTVTEAEWEAAGGLARLVDGEIVLGKFEAEIRAEENVRRITILKQKLAETDYIAAKIAEGSATVEEYADKIARRQAWRQEIGALSA